MRRLMRFFLSAAMAILFMYATVKVVALFDIMLGCFLPDRAWTGNTGLLFFPGEEDHYEMRDYTCATYINTLGFRDREITERKSRALRALAVGDSVTFGWGVDLEETWCKRLEANLCAQGIDIEILNLGLPAAGPVEYARIIETAIPRLKPDLVIVCFLAAEDLQQLGNFLAFDLDNYVKDTFPNLLYLMNRFQERNTPPPSAEPPKRSAADIREWYARTAREVFDGMGAEQRARFDRLENEIKQAFFDGRLNPWMIDQSTNGPDTFMETADYDNLGTQIRKATRQLKRMKHAVERNGARLIVLSAPEGFNVNKQAFQNVRRIGFDVVPEMLECDAPDRALAEACRRAGIDAFCCITDQMRQHGDEQGLFFEFDRHMTPAGNKCFADLVTPFVAAYIRK